MIGNGWSRQWSKLWSRSVSSLVHGESRGAFTVAKHRASAELLADKDRRPESVAAIRRIRHAATALQAAAAARPSTIARADADSAGQLSPKLSLSSLASWFRMSVSAFRTRPMPKDISLEVLLSPSPVTISADPIRIAQVLRNLVENAVRYTSAGRVQVRVQPFASRQRATGSAASSSDLKRRGADRSPVEGMGRICRL